MSIVRTRAALRLVVLMVLAAMVGAIGGYFAGLRNGETTERREQLTRDSARVSNGPWGNLRYWPTLLEMPADLVSIQSLSAPETHWYFGLDSPVRIRQLLSDCGMDEAMARRIAATAKPFPPTGDGFYATPADDDILHIPVDVRSRLYPALGRWKVNDAMLEPTSFSQVGSRAWLDDSKLPAQFSRLVKSLIYTNSQTELFADFEVVLRQMKDNRDARHFLRTMSRRNCLMGTLVVDSTDDIEPIVSYWGRGGREQEVRTIIEAAQWSDGTHEIPLIMLLPPFVRDRLYRYPRLSDPPGVNCHHAAMNFFNEFPDDAMTNLVECSKTIARDYERVPDTDTNYQLGDVILLMVSDREVIHSCNYIAGGIVFSKNGVAREQPWVLADLKETEILFGVERPITRHVVRKRQPAVASGSH